MFTIKHDSGSGLTIKGFDTNQNPKIESITPIDRVLFSDSDTMEVVDDKNVLRHTNASTVQDFDIHATSLTQRTYASSDEGIGTVDINGLASYVSDGSVSITIDCAQYGKLKTNVDMLAVGGETTDQFDSWADGTLAKEVNDAVDNAIDGLTPANSLNIYDVQDHVTPNYVRNTDCWINSWVQEATCMSPWNDANGQNVAGTLITQRHVLFAAHYHMSVGQVIRFIDVNNVVYERTITATKNHPDYIGKTDSYRHDLNVCALDEDLPAAISFCKLAPADMEDHFSDMNYGMAGLRLDKEEKALIGELYRIDYDGVFKSYFKAPITTPRSDYYETIISGDSSNPAFLIIDGEFVLITVWTHGGGGSGAYTGIHIADINQLITDVDNIAGDLTGYSVTVKDLSSYPTY